jgi:hypothetical protein
MEGVKYIKEVGKDRTEIGKSSKRDVEENQKKITTIDRIAQENLLAPHIDVFLHALILAQA